MVRNLIPNEFKSLDENGNTVVRLGRLQMFLQTAVLGRSSSKSRARHHHPYHDNDPESASDGPEEEDVRFQSDTGFEGQSRQESRYLLTCIDCLNLAGTSLTVNGDATGSFRVNLWVKKSLFW
jgi:hypothetical protein